MASYELALHLEHVRIVTSLPVLRSCVAVLLRFLYGRTELNQIGSRLRRLSDTVFFFSSDQSRSRTRRLTPLDYHPIQTALVGKDLVPFKCLGVDQYTFHNLLRLIEESKNLPYMQLGYAFRVLAGRDLVSHRADSGQ